MILNGYFDRSFGLGTSENVWWFPSRIIDSSESSDIFEPVVQVLACPSLSLPICIFTTPVDVPVSSCWEASQKLDCKRWPAELTSCTDFYENCWPADCIHTFCTNAYLVRSSRL